MTAPYEIRPQQRSGFMIQWLLCAYWAADRVEDARPMGEALQILAPNLSIHTTTATSPFRRNAQQAFIIDTFRSVDIGD